MVMLSDLLCICLQS